MIQKERPNGPETESRSAAKRLTLLFAVAYVSHGIATQFGLIAQPLQYFMMKGLLLTAAQLSSYMAIMMLPWTLKPIWGVFCDVVPLFGYRRKSYLILANTLTAIAFVVMACAGSLQVILTALFVAAVGMASSTAITVGLAVEQGKEGGKARDYFSQQTFFYYLALMAASVGGGVLCHIMAPEMALHRAASIAFAPPLIVSLLTLFLVREKKSKLDRQQLRKSWTSFKSLQNSAFWLVALFIFLWDFSPSFGIPLYFHESNVLKFSQSFIGQLGAWNSAGMVIGALIYRQLLRNRQMKFQLWLAIAAGTASSLAYLLLSTQASAIMLELGRGGVNMITILAIYALAADVCPAGMEVTVMATLLAVRNLGTEGSTYLGGQLYTHAFHNQLAPLIVVAAATTALCSFLIPQLVSQKTSQSKTGEHSSS